MPPPAIRCRDTAVSRHERYARGLCFAASCRRAAASGCKVSAERQLRRAVPRQTIYLTFTTSGVRRPLPGAGHRQQVCATPCITRGALSHSSAELNADQHLRRMLVPRRGLEPPRLSPLVPETSASTNSATRARGISLRGAAASCQCELRPASPASAAGLRPVGQHARIVAGPRPQACTAAKRLPKRSAGQKPEQARARL